MKTRQVQPTTSSQTDRLELGAMAEALAGAQFSQKQENEADDYGVEFCVKTASTLMQWQMP